MLHFLKTRINGVPFLIKGFIYFSLPLFLSILSKCVDPYYPQLGNYGSLLVVEGLITDMNKPYEIRLSRTIQSQDEKPEMVNNALVSVTDNDGNEFDFIEAGNGIYKSDSTKFIGATGKTYVLHISTEDGKRYESEPNTMLPVADIDSLYFEKDEEFVSDRKDIQTGISIFLDSGEGAEATKHYRWDYEETWKVKIPNPHRYEYYDDTMIVELFHIREYCWKNHKSDNIHAKSVLAGASYFIRKEPVCFIPSAASDRLTVGYSILVRQYSISEQEYIFWSDLKQSNETGGDIFEKQPYAVTGNIVNPDNPDEKVLGYFEVSGVKEKRIFIYPEHLKETKLPVFKSACQKYVVCPDDYPCNPPAIPCQTFDSINAMFMATGDFTFVEPVYDQSTGELMKLVFSANECSECDMGGIRDEPDFWIEYH